jgi:HK97 family phage prohead protease
VDRDGGDLLQTPRPEKGAIVNRETRTISGEVRAPGDGRTFEAVVMRYGVLDDYETIFNPGCFTASLEKRLPRITWSHDWTDVIGRVVDYKDTPDSLTVIGELDDFDAVPRARQAYAQLMSGTVDQFSVGFRRLSTEDVDGVTHFTAATLDEVACVLSGAVPDTELLSVRSVPIFGNRRVPETLVIDLGKQVAAGALTKAEALAALDLAAGGVDLAGMTPTTDTDDTVVVTDAGDVVLDTAADDALEALGMG